jgi:hypothetical protein
MLFGNKKISLAPAIIMSILPWSIVLSRATSEAMLGLTILTFGIMFLLASIEKKKLVLVVIADIFLVITYFIYPSFRLLSPLVILPLAVFVKDNKIWYFLSLIFFIVFTAAIISTPYGQGRFQQTSLMSSKELANRINSQNIALSYMEGNNNILMSRIFHNKAIGYLQEFDSQYFSYFSPQFLFLQGGLPDRYVVPNVGVSFIVFAFLLLGLLLPVSVGFSQKFFYYLLYLFLIAPLPAAITIEDVPNVNRDILMPLALVFLVSVGLLKILTLLKTKRNKLIFSSILILAILFEFTYFEHQYFVISPSYKPVLRNDGTKELIAYLKRYDSQTKIFLPLHDMPIYYLFFNNDFDKSLIGKFQPNLMVKQINNFNFSPIPCPVDALNQNKQNLVNTIIVEDGNCPGNSNFPQVTAILRKDSTVAFKILLHK